MWLYVRFPLLLLDRDLGTDTNANQAQALQNQRSIIEVNRAAQAAGVRTGQSLSTARSLCPELECRTPCPDRMRSQLEQLALWAYRF
ncbi:MAG: protein ImuB, partial [Bacteroidia bacterium]